MNNLVDSIPPGLQAPTIINLLSEQIGQRMRAVANEREAPGRNPDASDDFISHGKEEINHLRQIRLELESIFYGEIE